jgi:hypothetical protein
MKRARNRKPKPKPKGPPIDFDQIREVRVVLKRLREAGVLGTERRRYRIAPPFTRPGPNRRLVEKIGVRGIENSSLMTTLSYDGRARIGVR